MDEFVLLPHDLALLSRQVPDLSKVVRQVQNALFKAFPEGVHRIVQGLVFRIQLGKLLAVGSFEVDQGVDI
jgi:hypothetical protein